MQMVMILGSKRICGGAERERTERERTVKILGSKSRCRKTKGAWTVMILGSKTTCGEAKVARAVMIQGKQEKIK